jgi:hypothetical protein
MGVCAHEDKQLNRSCPMSPNWLALCLPAYHYNPKVLDMPGTFAPRFEVCLPPRLPETSVSSIRVVRPGQIIIFINSLTWVRPSQTSLISSPSTQQAADPRFRCPTG